MPVTIVYPPALAPDHPDVIVSDYPVDDGPHAPAPDDWTVLPAGPVRKLRMNVRWLQGCEGELPWVVEQGGVPLACRDVRLLGYARAVAADDGGCDGRGGWLETAGPVLVR